MLYYFKIDYEKIVFAKVSLIIAVGMTINILTWVYQVDLNIWFYGLFGMTYRNGNDLSLPDMTLSPETPTNWTTELIWAESDRPYNIRPDDKQMKGNNSTSPPIISTTATQNFSVSSPFNPTEGTNDQSAIHDLTTTKINMTVPPDPTEKRNTTTDNPASYNETLSSTTGSDSLLGGRNISTTKSERISSTTLEYSSNEFTVETIKAETSSEDSISPAVVTEINPNSVTTASTEDTEQIDLSNTTSAPRTAEYPNTEFTVDKITTETSTEHMIGITKEPEHSTDTMDMWTTLSSKRTPESRNDESIIDSTADKTKSEYSILSVETTEQFNQSADTGSSHSNNDFTTERIGRETSSDSLIGSAPVTEEFADVMTTESEQSDKSTMISIEWVVESRTDSTTEVSKMETTAAVSTGSSQTTEQSPHTITTASTTDVKQRDFPTSRSTNEYISEEIVQSSSDDTTIWTNRKSTPPYDQIKDSDDYTLTVEGTVAIWSEIKTTELFQPTSGEYSTSDGVRPITAEITAKEDSDMTNSGLREPLATLTMAEDQFFSDYKILPETTEISAADILVTDIGKGTPSVRLEPPCDKVKESEVDIKIDIDNTTSSSLMVSVRSQTLEAVEMVSTNGEILNADLVQLAGGQTMMTDKINSSTGQTTAVEEADPITSRSLTTNTMEHADKKSDVVSAGTEESIPDGKTIRAKNESLQDERIDPINDKIPADMEAAVSSAQSTEAVTMTNGDTGINYTNDESQNNYGTASKDYDGLQSTDIIEVLQAGIIIHKAKAESVGLPETEIESGTISDFDRPEPTAAPIRFYGTPPYLATWLTYRHPLLTNTAVGIKVSTIPTTIPNYLSAAVRNPSTSEHIPADSLEITSSYIRPISGEMETSSESSSIENSKKVEYSSTVSSANNDLARGELIETRGGPSMKSDSGIFGIDISANEERPVITSPPDYINIEHITNKAALFGSGESDTITTDSSIYGPIGATTPSTITDLELSTDSSNIRNSTETAPFIYGTIENTDYPATTPQTSAVPLLPILISANRAPDIRSTIPTYIGEDFAPLFLSKSTTGPTTVSNFERFGGSLVTASPEVVYSVTPKPIREIELRRERE